MTASLALEIRDLTKGFGGGPVLSEVSLQVEPGEIHALVGENGSGKSTLIKCLAGFHQPEAGEILVDGEPMPARYTAAQAAQAGLAFVHQDLGLVPGLSVQENIFLDRAFLTGRGRRIDWRRLSAAASQALAAFGHHDISPSVPVESVSRAMQTVVALARCMSGRRPRVIVMDEPTASLPRAERDLVFEAIRSAARQGVGIIYVSHYLDEIMALADRVTVLRSGQRVGSYPMSDLTHEDLVRHIVGRELDQLTQPRTHGDPREQEVVLELSRVSGRRIDELDLVLRRGEVVGVTGLLGCGRSELGRLVWGAQPASSGTIAVHGTSVPHRSPRTSAASGVAYVPENRLRDGIHAQLSVQDNVTLKGLRDVSARGVVRGSRQRALATGLVDRYNVQPRDVDLEIGRLSGGNQQKAVLAKWMSRDPDLLVLDEPVQGVDVGAKSEIYDLIAAASRRGTAVLMLGSELAEMARECHRVIVLRRGRVQAELSGAALTADKLSSLIYDEEQELP